VNYSYQRQLDIPFDDVDSKIRSTLKEQDFGVLTEINIHVAFKEKLDTDYNKYRILGACNPTLAKQALDYQLEVGMLMPCNVIFWENENGTVTFSAVDAEQQFRATDEEDLV